MTQIEDLVRQALAETPAPTTSTDPLATLDRRVRRARRRIAAGAGVAAAVVAAAVVVPLAVLGGGAPNSVKVVTPPTQKDLPAGTTLLWPNEAVSLATDSSGRVWVLYKESGHNYVQPVGASGVDKLASVQSPADYLLENGDTLWVIGHSRVTALDTHSGTSAALTLPDVTDAAVIQDSLYVLDHETPEGDVARIDFNDTGMGVTDSESLPNAREIVATAQGHLWVHAGNKLVELIPTAAGFKRGATEPWTGTLLAGSAGNTVWTTDDPERAVELDPKALAAGSSVALSGKRLSLPGQPAALVVDAAGGVFVNVGGQVDYFAPPNCCGPVTATLDGVQSVSMAADPEGGVDIVDDQGRLVQWDPAGAGSR